MSKRPALGRGIDALLGESQPQGAARELPVQDIDPNQDQPRRGFDPAELQDLADSVAVHGVLQPLIVERDGSRYRIVAGERRYRAAKMAGLTAVPVVVRATEGAERLEIALVENLQRSNLNPIEEAGAYRRLMELGAQTQDHVARRVGKNRATIANALRLLKLPQRVQQALAAGQVTAGHARALLSVAGETAQEELFERILAEGLTVRATEQAARLPLPLPQAGRTARRTRAPDAAVGTLEQELIDVLGTKVTIRGSSIRGRIEVAYYSADDLDRIREAIVGAGPD